MKFKFKFIIGAIAIMILLTTLFYSKQIANAIEDGIGICLNILIPSLFIFLVLSDFFKKTGLLEIILKPFSIVCSKLFKLDISLGPTLLFSLICGYPAGARLISDMVLSGKISKKIATRMLYFCVNSGPAFLIGGISVPLFCSIVPGIILFFSQIVAFFLVGIFSSIGKSIEKTKTNKNNMPITQAFVISVQDSAKSMAIICSFTLFFSGIIGLFNQLNILNINSNRYLKALLIGLIEVANGTAYCKNINGLGMFLIISLITSFGGICVHCQLKAILYNAKIKFGTFYLWRIIYCTISILVSWILFLHIKIPAHAFAGSAIRNHISTQNPISSIILIILSIALLCCDKKAVIIKNIYKRAK